MKILSGLSAAVAAVSIVIAVLTREQPLAFIVFCCLSATAMTALLVVIYLDEGASKVSPTGYVVMLLITWVVCFAIINEQSKMVEAEEAKQTVEDNIGETHLTLRGTLHSDPSDFVEWTALTHAMVSTDEYGGSKVEAFLTGDSFREELDIVLTLDDGTTALCESDKRVNWDQVGDLVRFEAGCDRGLSRSDRENLVSAVVFESTGVGRQP